MTEYRIQNSEFRSQNEKIYLFCILYSAFCILSSIFCSTAYAQIGTPTAGIESAVSTISLFWLVIKLIFALGLTGGLIYLFLFIVSKGKGVASSSELIRILGTKAVAPNKYIQIIEIAETILVIGIGESVTLLSEIKDKERIQLLKTEQSKEADRAGLTFKDHLSKLIKTGEDSLKGKLGFLDKKYEKLRRM
ncbi:MAG: flagellar biosynthetic protein FliO [bacterium]